MSAVRVHRVASATDIRSFIHLPWRIYRGDPHWVPPLVREIRATLLGVDNPLFAAGPHEAFLARRAPGEVVGRIVCGINEVVAKARGSRRGYLTLFESLNDLGVAAALFEAAADWLRARGGTAMLGPVSPTGGDDYRGLLVDAFDQPPVVMDSYNPPYYVELFERCGFEKEMDLYAYRYDLGEIPERYERAVDYAMRKFRFRVDYLDLRKLDREIDDLKRILDRAMPEDWEDMIPPRREDLAKMARRLKPLAVPEFVCIARTEEGEPIGFDLALPDYNQVLKHLNGRLFPVGWLKFLWYRRRIKNGRMFVLFVVPEYRAKGVPAAIFLKALLAARRRGYRWAEGSTVGETNLRMRREAEGVGGVHYKTYRIYRKNIAG